MRGLLPTAGLRARGRGAVRLGRGGGRDRRRRADGRPLLPAAMLLPEILRLRLPDGAPGVLPGRPPRRLRRLGGVPHRITYDNLGSAVTKILQGRTRQEHEQFIAFRGHYLFDSHFCLPGREGAHEKSLVESLVGYARRNFLVPIPQVDSWEALNQLLAERCAAEDARTVPGRAHAIGVLWQQEQARLRPVPRHPFPCCRTVAMKATRQALVSFERNRYSVPSRYAGERLVLRAYPWHVELSDGQTVVARHPRLYGRDGEQLDPLHYLQVLERKPGGFEGAR